MPTYSLRINGRTRQVEGEPDDNLLAVLRYELDLTGSKFGCGEGFCGACTVLVDNQATRACVTRLAAIGGQAITTIEGSRRATACIRCRKRFSRPRPSSAATARRGW